MYGAMLGTSFAGGSGSEASGSEMRNNPVVERKEDYSSYLSSLESYCHEYGYAMPSVGGTDYSSAYTAWKSVHSQWEAGCNRGSSQPSGETEYDIIPITYADGSIDFHDLNGNGDVAALKMPNGLYRMVGRDKLVTKLCGRAEFDALVKHLSDDNYFNDAK